MYNDDILIDFDYHILSDIILALFLNYYRNTFLGAWWTVMTFWVVEHGDVYIIAFFFSLYTLNVNIVNINNNKLISLIWYNVLIKISSVELFIFTEWIVSLQYNFRCSEPIKGWTYSIFLSSTVNTCVQTLICDFQKLTI